MRGRRTSRFRGRVASWFRGLAHYCNVLFEVVARHRVSVTSLYLVLLVAAGGTRYFSGTLEKNVYIGPVMLRLANAPTVSLPILLVLGTGLHAVIAYTRRRLILQLVAVAALLFFSAEVLCAFDKMFPATPRARLVAVFLPIVLIVMGMRGSMARIRRVLCVGLLILLLSILPVLLGRAASDEGPSRASQMAYLGSLAALWALGLLTWITHSTERPPSPGPHRLAQNGIRAQLAGARALTLVLLLPPYLSLDLATSVRQGDATLEAAYRMIVRSEVFTLFEKRLSETPASANFDGDAHQIVPGLGNVRASASCDATCSFNVSIETYNSSESFAFTFNGRDVSRGLLGARLVLARLAIENGVRLSGDASARDLYFALKDRIESRTVHIPGVDLVLSAPAARWAVAVAVIAVLILLRNRIGLALGDGGASNDEPWLLLDPMDGLERAVAAGYMLLIAASSSIVAGALMFTVETPVQASAVLVFFLLGLALSVSVIHRLLLLHVRRRAARGLRPSASNPSEESWPPLV